MTQEELNYYSESSRPAEPASASTKEGVGFATTRTHAVVAFLATRRWSRLIGYGVLIIACRIVRTIIRA